MTGAHLPRVTFWDHYRIEAVKTQSFCEPEKKASGNAFKRKWWPGTESNRRRQPFQGCELFFKGFTLALGADATILARAHLSAARIMIDLNLWWPGTESNRRRQPFQGCALPTELPGHYCWGTHEKSSVGPVEDFVRTERD